MSSSSGDRNPVEELAEQFLARKRNGEKPTLSEYAERYPDLADDIRELFPALVMMEDLGDSSLAATGPHEVPGAKVPERIGDYRILREVGRGGMGVVYEAEQESLGRRVALKVLPAQAIGDGQQLRRFEREARAAAKLHHTNIVPVFGVGHDGGTHYYVMQFIQGQGLDQVLEELKRLRKASGRRQPAGEGQDRQADACRSPVSEIAHSLVTGTFAPAVPPRSSDSSLTRLPGGSELSGASESGAGYWRSVARIGVQVAEALEYAHGQGILHRDIKPSNLLLDTHGTVWVTDFGLAKAGDADNLTHTGDIVGTIRYMAPERFAGRSDARSDVYALGLTLYELLAFQPVFAERDRPKLMQQVIHAEPVRLRKVNRAVPRDLETIVHKAMAKEAAERYPTARALAEDLQRFLEDRPIWARRASTRERFWRWCRRNPAVASLTAALVLVFLAGFVGIAWKWREAERQKDVAQAAEQEEAEQRAIAVEQADRARRLLYASDMSLAYQAWDVGDTGRAREFLARQRPQADQEDLRGFEWRYLCQLCRDGSRQTLRGHTGDVLTLRGHTGDVTTVAFAPDGKTLATVGGDKSVCIWGLASGRHLKLFVNWATGAAFTPDGKTLAISEFTGRDVRLWDVAARRERAILPHPADVSSVAISPDGKLLATGGEEPRIRLWDVATGKEAGTLEGKAATIVGVVFSPDGRLLASGDPGFGVCLWDVAARRQIAILRGHTFVITSICFSPDGKTLATASGDSTVRLWDTATGQALKTIRAPRMVLRSAAFSPDGKTLATGGGDGTVRLWDPVTQEVVALFRGHTAAVTAIAFAPDGHSLASGSLDGTVKLWDVAAGQDPNTLTGHKGIVGSVAFARDGKHVAVADGIDNSVKLWDLASRRPVVGFQSHEVALLSVTLAPDGKTLATTSLNGPIRLWDITRQEQLAEFRNADTNDSAEFSPDGKLLAAGCWGAERVLVWDIRTRQQVARLEPGMKVRFSPDGALLAASSGNAVRLWDVATWQKVAELPGHMAQVLCLAFAPDGRTLATGDAAGTVYLWDVAQRRQVASRRGHTSHVASVAFSPDGRRLATGSGDSTVKLWDLELLQEVATLTGHAALITSVTFSPDGNTLVSASADTTVRLWQAPSGLAGLREPADSPSAVPTETAHLFALELLGAARARLVPDGDAHRVDVLAVDGTDWDAQLVQVFDNLEEGATYTIRFRAKADAPRGLTLVGQIFQPDWNNIGLWQGVPLTQEWQPYRFEFRATKLAATNKIGFIVGERTGSVWIADFTVTKEAK